MPTIIPKKVGNDGQIWPEQKARRSIVRKLNYVAVASVKDEMKMDDTSVSSPNDHDVVTYTHESPSLNNKLINIISAMEKTPHKEVCMLLIMKNTL